MFFYNLPKFFIEKPKKPSIFRNKSLPSVNKKKTFPLLRQWLGGLIWQTWVSSLSPISPISAPEVEKVGSLIPPSSPQFTPDSSLLLDRLSLSCSLGGVVMDSLTIRSRSYNRLRLIPVSSPLSSGFLLGIPSCSHWGPQKGTCSYTRWRMSWF